MAALVIIQNSRNRAGDIRETTWPIWRRPWWWLGGMVVGQVGRLDAKMERTHRQFLFPRNPYMDFSPYVENFQMHCGFGNKFGRKCRSSENFTPPLFAPAHYSRCMVSVREHAFGVRQLVRPNGSGTHLPAWWGDLAQWCKSICWFPVDPNNRVWRLAPRSVKVPWGHGRHHNFLTNKAQCKSICYMQWLLSWLYNCTIRTDTNTANYIPLISVKTIKTTHYRSLSRWSKQICC